MLIIDQKLSILLVVLSSPLIILTTHILFSRIALAIKSVRPPQFICVISVLFGNAPFFLLLWLLSFKGYGINADGPAVNFLSSSLYALIVYNLMGYAYFHVYNMSETARRVRILYDIYSKGSLTKADIEKIYNKGDMVAVRIERLLALGQIKKENDAYLLDGRFLYYAALLLAFWSRLIGLPLIASDDWMGDRRR